MKRRTCYPCEKPTFLFGNLAPPSCRCSGSSVPLNPLPFFTKLVTKAGSGCYKPRFKVAQKELDVVRKAKECRNRGSFKRTGRHVCSYRRTKKDSEVDVFPLYLCKSDFEKRFAARPGETQLAVGGVPHTSRKS